MNVPLGSEIKHLPLEGNGSQIAVKGALAVRGDEDKGVRGGVHIANFACERCVGEGEGGRKETEERVQWVTGSKVCCGVCTKRRGEGAAESYEMTVLLLLVSLLVVV